MAKISRQVREIINIVLFLIVVGLLLTFYMIYPLNKTADFMMRDGETSVNPDSLPVNDPAAFVEAGFSLIDTFRVEADGLTNLALVCLTPELDSAAGSRGTVVLLHDEVGDRSSVISLAEVLVDSGFAVVAYDQRASGRSTGDYHGEGQYEASDLVEVVGYLDLRNRLKQPVTAVGFSLGGEAALLAGQQEDRITEVIAVDPYLSSSRMLDLQKDKYEAIWFPFYRTIMWWWYGMRSGYAAPYRTIDDIRGIGTTTLLLLPETSLEDPEIVRLKELSVGQTLQIETQPEDEASLNRAIIEWIMR